MDRSRKKFWSIREEQINFHFNFSSKTKYEEILAKVEKRQILDNDDDDDDGEADSESVEAYKQYIAEIMAAMVFYDNPTMDLEKHIPSMKTAAESILKITKAIYQVRMFIDLASCQLLGHLVFYWKIQLDKNDFLSCKITKCPRSWQPREVIYTIRSS